MLMNVSIPQAGRGALQAAPEALRKAKLPAWKVSVSRNRSDAEPALDPYFVCKRTCQQKRGTAQAQAMETRCRV